MAKYTLIGSVQKLEVLVGRMSSADSAATGRATYMVPTVVEMQQGGRFRTMTSAGR